MISSRQKEECIEQFAFPDFPKPTIKDKIQVGKLLSIKRIEQRSPEWFELRMTMITASDWATAIGEGHFNTKESFILGKCGKGPKFKGNIYTEWGVKYENVATRLYELRSKIKVYEFGVLKHPKYSFLGASPDGITAKGIMLEIKCPYSRKITGIVPKHYWQQVQGQLEVCDLQFCDFLECKITEYSGMTEYLEDTEENAPFIHFEVDKELQKKYKDGRVFLRTKDKFEKGAVLTYNTPEGDNKYFHSELGVSKEEFEEWCANIKKSVPSSWTERRVSFWRFDKISCVRIERDTNWFKEVLPKLEEVWNEVEHYRLVGCESLLKKTKEPDYFEEADISEINALVNTTDGYDDIADFIMEPAECPDIQSDDYDDIPDNVFETFSLKEKALPVAKDVITMSNKISLKPSKVILYIKNDIPKKQVNPPSPTMSNKIIKPKSSPRCGKKVKTEKVKTEEKEETTEFEDKWSCSQLEAIFDLELGSWTLPKYIPLNPFVLDDRSIEEFKMNLAGSCKIVSRCKTALVRLVKCPAESFDNSEINIKNIVYRVNNWFSGLSAFLKDLLKSLEFKIPKDLKKSIIHTQSIVDTWTDKLYPKWVAMWEVEETSSEEESDDSDDSDSLE